MAKLFNKKIIFPIITALTTSYGFGFSFNSSVYANPSQMNSIQIQDNEYKTDQLKLLQNIENIANDSEFKDKINKLSNKVVNSLVVDNLNATQKKINERMKEFENINPLKAGIDQTCNYFKLNYETLKSSKELCKISQEIQKTSENPDKIKEENLSNYKDSIKKIKTNFQILKDKVNNSGIDFIEDDVNFENEDIDSKTKDKFENIKSECEKLKESHKKLSEVIKQVNEEKLKNTIEVVLNNLAYEQKTIKNKESVVGILSACKMTLPETEKDLISLNYCDTTDYLSTKIGDNENLKLEIVDEQTNTVIYSDNVFALKIDKDLKKELSDLEEYINSKYLKNVQPKQNPNLLGFSNISEFNGSLELNNINSISNISNIYMTFGFIDSNILNNNNRLILKLIDNNNNTTLCSYIYETNLKKLNSQEKSLFFDGVNKIFKLDNVVDNLYLPNFK